MPSPILARADALMQRRRQSGGDNEDVPVLTDAVLVEDDLAARLDLEPTPAPAADFDEAPRTGTGTQAMAPENLALDAGVRDILAHELARRVEQRLAAELPRIIESTVRDFLAEHDRIAALQARD